jgi:hypothetical protein
MPRPHGPRKPKRKAEAVATRLLDAWLTNTRPGQQLLTSRTLPEARVAVRELITAGLLDVQVIDLPAGDQSVDIFPTPLALATMEPPPSIQRPQ